MLRRRNQTRVFIYFKINTVFILKCRLIALVSTLSSWSVSIICYPLKFCTCDFYSLLRNDYTVLFTYDELPGYGWLTTCSQWSTTRDIGFFKYIFIKQWHSISECAIHSFIQHKKERKSLLAHNFSVRRTDRRSGNEKTC